MKLTPIVRSQAPLRIQVRRAARISGVVLDRSGRPARHVEVEVLRGHGVPQRYHRKELIVDPNFEAPETRLEDRIGNLSTMVWNRLGRSVKTDEHGRFQFGQLKPGRYGVVVRMGPDQTASRPCWVRTGTHDVTVRLGPTRDVVGRVDASALMPPLGAREFAYCFARAFVGGIEYRRVFVKTDGTYELKCVPQGQLEIRFSSTRGVSARSVKVDGYGHPPPLRLFRPTSR